MYSLHLTCTHYFAVHQYFEETTQRGNLYCWSFSIIQNCIVVVHLCVKYWLVLPATNVFVTLGTKKIERPKFAAKLTIW